MNGPKEEQEREPAPSEEEEELVRRNANETAIVMEPPELRQKVSMATSTSDDPFPSRRKQKRQEGDLAVATAEEIEEDPHGQHEGEVQEENSRRSSLRNVHSKRSSSKSNVTIADSTSEEDLESTRRRRGSESFLQWRMSSISMQSVETCAEGLTGFLVTALAMFMLIMISWFLIMQLDFMQYCVRSMWEAFESALGIFDSRKTILRHMLRSD